MESRIDDTTVPLVSCEMCLKRVAKDVAESAEAATYTAYFCGAQCLQRWRAKTGQRSNPKA